MPLAESAETLRKDKIRFARSLSWLFLRVSALSARKMDV
jgi:hypothetical protein